MLQEYVIEVIDPPAKDIAFVLNWIQIGVLFENENACSDDTFI